MTPPAQSDAAGARDDSGVGRRIGILTTDTELVVKSWDATLEQMTGVAASAAKGRALDELVPDLAARGLLPLLREPIVSGAAQVLAPALHKYLIPCQPIDPSTTFDRMQQRVVIGALRDEQRAVGLVIAIEDVTARLERERELARQLRNADAAERLATIERLSQLDPTDGLGPLGTALRDDHWQVRRSAVRALSACGDASLVDAVVSALRDGHRNFSLLSSALQLLTVTGLDLTAALIDLLRSPDADLRVQAALALGTQRSADSVSALVQALDDSDANVRFHAIEALGKLRAPEAIERLVAFAQAGDFFAAFPAVESLVRIGDATIAPRLVPLLRDQTLAAQVADALGQLGDEHAVPPLVGALDWPGAPAVAIANALVAIHDRSSELFGGAATVIEDAVRQRLSPSGADRLLDALRTASRRDLRNVIVVIGWLNGAPIQRALAHLLGTSGVHHDVIEALVRFGAPAVDLLIAQLGRDDADARRAAVTALGRIGDRRAVPALTALLVDDTRDVWVPVAGALARIGDGRAFETLLALLGDDDASVRQAAIGALNSIGHPDMEARIGALLEDANARVRESAVRIAGYFGYAHCAGALAERCRDSDEGVRAAALEHLPYFDDPRTLAMLRDALAGDAPRARAAAAHALGAMAGPATTELLRRAIADDDSWVRYFGAISLGRVGNASVAADLERLVTSDPARYVRIAAVEALGIIDGPDTVDILGPIAASDEADLAQAAIRALGRVATKRVAAPLRVALRSVDARRRIAAAESLAACGDSEAVALLRTTAASDGDPGVIRAALNTLVTLADRTDDIGRSAIGAIVDQLAAPARRDEAVRALSRVAPGAIPRVAEHLSAGDPQTRHGVADALGRMTHPVASVYLQRALDDADPLVRRRAIASLSRLGTRGIGRRLALLARTDPSPAVRDAAAAAMSREAAADDTQQESAQVPADAPEGPRGRDGNVAS